MGHLYRLWGVAALVTWPLLVGAQQTPPELTGILERLDRLERENRALAEEVKALRARLDSAGETKSATPAAAASTMGAMPEGTGYAKSAANAAVETGPPPLIGTPEEQLEIEHQRIAELAQTKVEASQRFPIRLTGMALFNAFMNSKQNGGSDNPVTASDRGLGRAGATLRQSIVGLEFRGPVTVWGGNVSGSVFMDFFAGDTTQTVRLRTAAIAIDWKTRSVSVGLEKPIFNPREPSSLARVGISPLTGSGNLWLWLPQVKVEQDFRFSSSNGLRAQMGVVQTREAGPYVGSTFTGAVESTRPGLEGRYLFYHNLDEDRRLEIATGFHSSVTHAGGFRVNSRVFSLDWFFNPWRRVEFTGEFFRGRNVTPLGAGYQQGFEIDDGYAEVVGCMGGWGQITVHAAQRVDLHLFTGQQDDRNRNLAAAGIGKNLTYGGNVYYRLAPNVVLGLEATQLRTVYLGRGVRINNHYDLALAYFF